jgi:hypothetical protein
LLLNRTADPRDGIAVADGAADDPARCSQRFVARRVAAAVVLLFKAKRAWKRDAKTRRSRAAEVPGVGVPRFDDSIGFEAVQIAIEGLDRARPPKIHVGDVACQGPLHDGVCFFARR